MPLRDDILALRDRTLADLDAAYDYYTDSIFVWNFVGDAVAAGSRFRVASPTTGTVKDQNELAAKAGSYIAEQLAEATFQQFLSVFENFFFEFLRLWLLAYPRSLLARQVDFRTVLDAPDKDAIAQHVVSRALNEVLYDRPANWFVYLEETAKLGCPTADEIARVAEAKATRDVLAHARGVVGKAYLSKAGPLARAAVGDRIEVTVEYHRATWILLKDVAAAVCDAAALKV